MDISFSVTREDSRIIKKIVERAASMVAAQGGILDRMSTAMDITATHANGNPLRLADLLNADDFNFAHDVFGIARHLDRSTGRLTGHFSPRYSQREAAAA